MKDPRLKKAFTMIELVFVIVILGILASVAIPKLSGVTEDANFVQGRATVSSIRSGINTQRQSNLIRGNYSWPAFLDNATNAENQELFDGNGTGSSDIRILQYPIYAGTDLGSWKKVTNVTGTADELKYNFYYSGGSVEFTYTKADGKFDCTPTDATNPDDPCVRLAR